MNQLAQASVTMEQDRFDSSDDEDMDHNNYASSSDNETDVEQNYYLSQTDNETDHESDEAIEIVEPESVVGQTTTERPNIISHQRGGYEEHVRFMAMLEKKVKETIDKAATNQNIPQPKKRGRPRLNKNAKTAPAKQNKSGI